MSTFTQEGAEATMNLSGNFNNNNTVDNSGGRIVLTGSITNNATKDFTNKGSIIGLNGTIENKGTLDNNKNISVKSITNYRNIFIVI